MVAMSTLTLRGSGMDKYPAKAHAQRVAAELNIPNGLILLQGAKTKFYPNSDQPIPFRQNRYFYYLTGCNEPGCWATYQVEKDKLTLWLPKPVGEGMGTVFFDGKACTKKEAAAKFDVDEVKYIRAPNKDKPKRTNIRKMFMQHYKKGGEFAFFRMPNTLVGKKLRMKMKERRKAGLRNAMNKTRAVKDEHEVALIRKANAVSSQAHMRIMENLYAIKAEPEVEAMFLSNCIARGAKEQAYGPICGSGANAGQLHYIDNDQAFGDSAQVLLVDAGAQWEQYASDITRSMPINPSMPGSWSSKEAELVYNAVAKIQDSCIQQLAPGKKFLHVSWAAIHMSIDALIDLGVLKGDHMDIFHAGTILAFFPHGLGHHVGLEVHDVAPLPAVKGLGKKGAGKKGAGKKGKGMGAKDGPGKKGKGMGAKKGPGKKAGMKKNAEKKGAEWEVVEREVIDEQTIVDEKTAPQVTEIEASSFDEKSIEKKGKGGGLKKGKQGTGQKNGKGKMGGKGKMAGAKNGKKFGPKKAARMRAMRPQDVRFRRTQGCYRVFSAGNDALASRAPGLKPIHYSLNPRLCKAPNTPTAPKLEAGNVLTIEPGLYFNRFILEKFYLNKKKHAKFIDQEVLQRFMPVGGVRIEDTVLITKTGYEVLSADAPKGDAMLSLIREGASQAV